MKIGIYTDIHFSYSTSSMRRGRLQSLIDTFEWMYDKFEEHRVELIVNCGDLLNSDTIKPEENKALSEALGHSHNIKEIHLLGNHEMKSADGKVNSLSILGEISEPDIEVITTPTRYNDEISFLPYRDFYSTQDIENIKNKIIFSHIECEGMVYPSGKVIQNGISMELLSNNSELVINGHIHSKAEYMNSKIVNIGSSVGHNFSDNYKESLPSIYILDTDTLELTSIVNPKAMLYFKYSKVETLSDLVKYVNSLDVLANPKFIRVSTSYKMAPKVLEYLESLKGIRIVDFKLITYQNPKVDSEVIEFSDDKVDKYTDMHSMLVDYVESLDIETLPRPRSEIMSYLSRYYSKTGGEA